MVNYRLIEIRFQRDATDSDSAHFHPQRRLCKSLAISDGDSLIVLLTKKDVSPFIVLVLVKIVFLPSVISI